MSNEQGQCRTNIPEQRAAGGGRRRGLPWRPAAWDNARGFNAGGAAVSGTATIEFWYEFASTYSYPTAMRIEAASAEHGVAVRWQPFLLGPIFTALGWPTSPFNLQPAKGAYMWRDLERTCGLLGLPFRRPDPFPQNSLLAARAALTLPDDGARARFSRAVYAAEFGDGATIGDAAVIAALLDREGFHSAAVLDRAAARATKQALRRATEQAEAHGIFGAPTLRTPDGELFWGNDRVNDALLWAQATAA